MNSAPLRIAREAKHRLLVTAPAAVTAASTAVTDHLLRLYDRASPYRYDLRRYETHHAHTAWTHWVHRDPTESARGEEPHAVPRVIWSFWTGQEPMSANRRAGLESMREHTPDVPIELITANDLARIEVPGHPLHPALEHLSSVHRSDYLRAYVMHHHGGGYSDIKPHTASWSPAFDVMDADSSTWIIGYPESSHRAVGGGPHRLGRELRAHYASLIGPAAFITRPRTDFTAGWLTEVERRLSYYLEPLRANPGNTFGDNPGYPIPWITLMSDVFHPLQMKHLSHVRQDQRLRPVLRGHR